MMVMFITMFLNDFKGERIIFSNGIRAGTVYVRVVTKKHSKLYFGMIVFL